LIQVKGKVETDLVYESLGRAREVERAFAHREKSFGAPEGVAVLGS
jgi:hypothetical protein